MKTFISIFIVLIVMMFWQNSFAAAKQTSYTYKTVTGDIGTISKTAATRSDAFALAANECYTRRVSLYETKRGEVSEDRSLDIIDSCVNLPY